MSAVTTFLKTFKQSWVLEVLLKFSIMKNLIITRKMLFLHSLLSEFVLRLVVLAGAPRNTLVS